MEFYGRGKPEGRKRREEDDHHMPIRIKKEPEKWGYDERPSHFHKEMKPHQSRQRDERASHSQEARAPHRHRDRHEHKPRDWREQQQERKQNDRRREDDRRDQPDSVFATVKEEDNKKPKDKEKPNFELSGKLTEDTNTFRGVVIKYSEPPEARKPKRHWRLYTFKGDTTLPTLHIHRQSAYLMGRDRRVADIPIDHPSCSKQHAALQYRLVNYRRPDGKQGRRVRLYVIDLNSANGTYVNNQRIEPQKYVELLEKDVIKFGFSTREYVLLHDNTDTSELQADEEDFGAD